MTTNTCSVVQLLSGTNDAPFTDLEGHLGRHLELLQMLFYFISIINEQYLAY